MSVTRSMDFKSWYMYTIELYFAITYMTFVGKWIELEITPLSEINQTQTNAGFLLCGS